MSLALMDSYNPTVQALQKQNKKLRSENKKLKSEISVQSYWGIRWEKEHAVVEAQEAEITKLKEVIAKCRKVLQSWPANMIYKSDEALAAIKEIEK